MNELGPLDRLAQKFGDGDPDQLAHALRSRPTFQGDLTWLSQLLDAAEQLPMPDVPASVSASLHDLMPSRRDLRMEDAASIHDSRRDTVLVGARGEQHLDGWTAAFSAASADVLIDGDPTTADQTDISGHVLVRGDESRAFTVRATGDHNIAVRSNELGLFHLGSLPNGVYEMSARCPEFEVQWSIEVGS
ncbi:MAG: hypothetical protein HKN94_03305 [Acidimicrobiales bacterium]|nr:hypothetical protein [Acidimicrobiales bacterium]RZV46084.1 MAG: hypothetical protein EX269_08255 [Acidimicrobiales bacterium]